MKAASFLLGSFLGLACAASAEDLLQVYQDALSNDPQIREAEATRRATREVRPQAWSALLPQIEAFGQFNRVQSDDTQVSPISGAGGIVTLVPVPRNGTTDTTGYTINLRQNVFSWSNWMTLRQASKEVAQAEADYQTATQDLVLRAAQAYFNVLAAQDTVEALQAAYDAIARQYEQASKRFEVGLIAVTDVQEAQAARDSAAAALIDAKRQLSTAQQLLRELTNREYAILVKPGDTMLLKTPEPADMQKWVELSMAQNSALVSSRLAADVARANVGIARGGHLPSIDIVGSRVDSSADVNTTSSGSTFDFSTDSKVDTIGVRVNLPIFSGGFTQSRVRQAEYQWIAAKERMTRVSRQTERLARDSYLGVISEMARVQALRQALQSSQTALKATQAGYEVGTRTAVDVLTAQQTLAQAQTNYARSRYDYLLNVIQLRQAAGNLDQQTLAEINQWIKTAPAAPPGTTPAPAP